MQVVTQPGVPARNWWAAVGKTLPGPRRSITIWLRVGAAKRPDGLGQLLADIGGPDFELERCRESALLSAEGAGHYSAHWCCRFSRNTQDELDDLRLLKRLTQAGFHILRFDGAA